MTMAMATRGSTTRTTARCRSTRGSAGALPWIEVGLQCSMRAAVRAAHVAHLEPMSGKMQCVRLEHTEAAHRVPAEITDLHGEIMLRHGRDACAIARARSGKAC